MSILIQLIKYVDLCWNSYYTPVCLMVLFIKDVKDNNYVFRQLTNDHVS